MKTRWNWLNSRQHDSRAHLKRGPCGCYQTEGRNIPKRMILATTTRSPLSSSDGLLLILQTVSCALVARLPSCSPPGACSVSLRCASQNEVSQNGGGVLNKQKYSHIKRWHAPCICTLVRRISEDPHYCQVPTVKSLWKLCKHCEMYHTNNHTHTVLKKVPHLL
jgi:hypothetical protein